MTERVKASIPRTRRITLSLLTLSVTQGICIAVFIYLYTSHQVYPHIFYMSPLCILGLYLSFKIWKTTEIKEPTAEEIEQKNKIEQIASERENEFMGCLSSIVGVVVFIGCWLYAIKKYGWFIGLAFGWIPASIISAIAYATAPIAIIVVILVALEWFRNA